MEIEEFLRALKERDFKNIERKYGITLMCEWCNAIANLNLESVNLKNVNHVKSISNIVQENKSNTGPKRILRQPTKVERFGIAIRLVDYGEHEKYRRYYVEFAPLNSDGSTDDEWWGVFGGGVGSDDSSFETLKEAENFFDDVLKLNGEQMLKKYPKIWLE